MLHIKNDTGALPNQEEVHNSLEYLLRRAQQAYFERFYTEFGGRSISPRQFAVLAALQGNDNITQTQLGNLIGIDRSTIADLVQRMEKKGLIHRQRSVDDPRANLLKLSPEGIEQVEKHRAAEKRAQDHVLEAIPADDLAQFRALLTLVGNQK